MSNLPIIYDQYGSAVRVVHAADDSKLGDAFTIETIEDCEPILDQAKALREDHKSRSDMKHVARVPLTVVERAVREGWFHDEAAWDRWLNDPDNKHFRVWEGRV